MAHTFYAMRGTDEELGGEKLRSHLANLGNHLCWGCSQLFFLNYFYWSFQREIWYSQILDSNYSIPRQQDGRGLCANSQISQIWFKNRHHTPLPSSSNQHQHQHQHQKQGWPLRSMRTCFLYVSQPVSTPVSPGVVVRVSFVFRPPAASLRRRGCSISASYPARI